MPSMTWDWVTLPVSNYGCSMPVLASLLTGNERYFRGGSAGTNLHEACMLPSCEKTQVRLATSA
jgi:hypothetical protein